MRFSDLERAIPNITQKMLGQQLRSLAVDGIVVRTAYPQVPPTVEYCLTSWGQSLCLTLSLSSRIPSTRPRNHQSASWRRAPARLRSRRLWPSQRRFGGWYSSRQRGEEAGHPPRRLVDGRARQCALASPPIVSD